MEQNLNANVPKVPVKKDKKDEIPVVRTKPLYFNTFKDTTPTKDCSDFPFTLGCVNSKIGDLNASLFMGDRDDNKYTKELQHFLDYLQHAWERSSDQVTNSY